MPVLKEIKLDKGLLVLWDIAEELDTLLEMCRDFGIEKELDGFKNIRRKKEWLAVRLLLKHIDCNRSGETRRKNTSSNPIPMSEL